MAQNQASSHSSSQWFLVWRQSWRSIRGPKRLRQRIRVGHETGQRVTIFISAQHPQGSP